MRLDVDGGEAGISLRPELERAGLSALEVVREPSRIGIWIAVGVAVLLVEVTAARIASWSQATTTRVAALFRTCSKTLTTSGFPATSASILPGKRVAAWRAGMMSV